LPGAGAVAENSALTKEWTCLVWFGRTAEDPSSP